MNSCLRLRLLAAVLHACAMIVAFSPAHAQEPRIGGTARLQAWKLHQEMAESSLFKDLPWQALGPRFCGGRIESIDVPRGDVGTIYAGVGAGGVWKSTNGGLTWDPIFHRESTYAIGDLTVAPGNPDIVWVGTGECHLSSSSYAGNGVFKSTDGGKSWSNMGLHESAHIGRVVIDPTDSNTVYVAAMGRQSGGGQRGIFKTSDGGTTFRQVLFVDDFVSFVDLCLDPNDNNRLFAAAWDRKNGSGSGVYRSEDGGEHWKRLGAALLAEQVDRIAIDVATSRPGVVYALMADRSSPELAKRGQASVLFRSDDHGESWNRTHEGYLPTYVGWDFCDVRVSPDDADLVYVGGLRLIISHDGGRTFEGEGGFAINRKKDEVFRLYPHGGTGMHLDVHDIWIDPENPRRVMLGNDGGLFISWDRAQTWLHLNNLPIAEFYRIHLDNQTPFNIWGGTQDNASLAGSSTSRLRDGENDQWRHVFLDPWSGGDGFATFPDPNDSQVTFYTQQNGDLKRVASGKHQTAKSIRPHHQPGEPELRFAWDTPFFASTHPGQTVLYCAAQRVLRSLDSGQRWEAISPDLAARGLLALAESPLDRQRLIAGGSGGQIHLTDDGGSSWHRAGEGIPVRTIRNIAASAHNPDRIYVAVSGKTESDSASYVFRSDDFGKTWNSIASNLPHESVNVLAEDPKTEGLIFAGTDLGVYVSTNDGSNWESLCGTLPTAPVVDLAIQERDGALVAATHGLGVFLLEIGEIRANINP